MKRKYQWMSLGFALIAISFGAATFFYALPLVAIGAAYKAKILCSAVFVSKRDPHSIVGTDLEVGDLSLFRHVRLQIDYDSHEVTTDFFGLAKRKAVYHQGRGCVIVHGASVASVVKGPKASKEPARTNPSPKEELEASGAPPPEFDRSRLNAALEWAFSERDPAAPSRTRAVVVVYKGRLISERYAPGFTKSTPLLGWSMTKSVVNALVGVLVRQGKVSLSKPVPIPEWQRASDTRRGITFEQLLHMTSGLQFDEDYGNPLSDVTYMLFGVPNAVAYAAAKPLEAEPGAHWRYSSGTTNIIAYAIRQIVGDPDYLEFPRHALFDRLGMTSAVMETDASGTFVGSSFMYATARDWARFGLLYLHDGVWSGERILPEGWVAFTRAPAPPTLDRQYGAHFWLRIPEEYRCGKGSRELPADAFHANGYEGQFITIIPSRELVLVRLGLTHYPCAWDHQVFVDLVLRAFENDKPANPALQRTRQEMARP
jgi:CubicO group peptidase (beta-lactamase class C family)